MAGWLKRCIARHKERQTAIKKAQEEQEQDAAAFATRWEAHQEEIQGLTNIEAQQRFFTDLEAGAFKVEYATADNTIALPQLPETLRDLFSRFARVTCVRSLYEIDQSQIEGCEDWLPGFLILGYADETTLLINPPEDGIYELFEGETEADLEFTTYPTIYHYLLAENFD